MNDHERRALISFHAKQLGDLNIEVFQGSGLITGARIVERLERMLELAKELTS